MFSQLVLADNNNGRHWSEGIYFPPQTMQQQQPRESYAPDYRSESHPRPSPAGTPKYNPWVKQRKDSASQRFLNYESLGYPSQDYDPYRNRAKDPRRLPAEKDTYSSHPGDFAAAEYYSGQSRYGQDPSTPHAEYWSRDYDQIHGSRSYFPGYGMQNYITPYHDVTDLPWSGLNPFFMYGVGSPYLPQWW